MGQWPCWLYPNCFFFPGAKVAMEKEAKHQKATHMGMEFSALAFNNIKIGEEIGLKWKGDSQVFLQKAMKGDYGMTCIILSKDNHFMRFLVIISCTNNSKGTIKINRKKKIAMKILVSASVCYNTDAMLKGFGFLESWELMNFWGNSNTGDILLILIMSPFPPFKCI